MALQYSGITKVGFISDIPYHSWVEIMVKGDETSFKYVFMWRDGEFPEMFQPFIEYINGGSRNNGSRKLFPIFDDPRRTGLSFPSAMVGVLQCLEGVVS